MITGFVMMLYVYSAGSWQVVKPLSNDIYPTYEVCQEYSRTVLSSSDEVIQCEEVRSDNGPNSNMWTAAGKHNGKWN